MFILGMWDRFIFFFSFDYFHYRNVNTSCSSTVLGYSGFFPQSFFSLFAFQFWKFLLSYSQAERFFSCLQYSFLLCCFWSIAFLLYSFLNFHLSAYISIYSFILPIFSIEALSMLVTVKKNPGLIIPTFLLHLTAVLVFFQYPSNCAFCLLVCLLIFCGSGHDVLGKRNCGKKAFSNIGISCDPRIKSLLWVWTSPVLPSFFPT